MQNSVYLQCFLQFGELQSANRPNFTALFAIWGAKQCKIASIDCAFAIWRAKMCKIAYIDCVFYNFENPPAQLGIMCPCQAPSPMCPHVSNVARAVVGYLAFPVAP